MIVFYIFDKIKYTHMGCQKSFLLFCDFYLISIHLVSIWLLKDVNTLIFLRYKNQIVAFENTRPFLIPK